MHVGLSIGVQILTMGRVVEFPGSGVEEIMNCLMWVLEIAVGSSARAVGDFNC